MIGFFREHQNLAAFIIMAAVAVLFFHPLLARISTHILTDGAFIPDGFSDAYNFLWSYWWFQKAFASGKNLFLCDWIYPPDGENLLFHTHIFLPSILSIPISRVIGTIPAFNLTILTMLVLAAFSYYLFVRNTFGTSFYAAVVAGLMFGFSPYFLFKAHSHLNLVGACFWGSCLGILIHAYVRNAFSIRAAIACSLFFWATFWTSFLEFFMLSVAVALVVAVFERSSPPPISLKTRLVFFAFLIPGAVSLGIFQFAPEMDRFTAYFEGGYSILRFFRIPRLNLLYISEVNPVYEFWGSYIPLSAMVLAALGVWRRSQRPLSILAVCMFLLMLDPYEVLSAILHTIPVANGFRMMCRFLPFFFFFGMVFVAFGVDAVLAMEDASLRGKRIALIFLIGLVEFFPFRLQPSPIESMQVPRSVVDRLDASGRVVVIPVGTYTQVLDTWQIALERPFLRLSFLARFGRMDRERRLRYPYAYADRIDAASQATIDELKTLGVKYLVFEGGATVPENLGSGKRICQASSGLLLELKSP